MSDSNRPSAIPRVIVCIRGGNYQGHVSTVPVDVQILDFDNWDDKDCSAEDYEYYRKLDEERDRLEKLDPQEGS